MWEKMTPVWENTLTSSYVKWSSRTGAWWWGCVGWHTEYIYFTHRKVANPVGAAACHRLTMQIGSNLVNKYVSAGERTSYILTQLRPRQSVHFYPPVLFGGVEIIFLRMCFKHCTQLYVYLSSGAETEHVVRWKYQICWSDEENVTSRETNMNANFPSCSLPFKIWL